MSILTDRMGSDYNNPSESQIEQALESLKENDPEHSSVSLRTEEGWTVSVYPSGLLIFENIEQASPVDEYEMTDQTMENAKQVWQMIKENKIAEIKKLNWKLRK